MEPQKVPQHINDEDKIVGPLSFRQLGILGVGGGICYIFYNNQIPFWPIVIAIVLPLTIAFTFVKVAGLTFFQYFLAFLHFSSNPNQAIWKKEISNVEKIDYKMKKEQEDKMKKTKKETKIDYSDKLQQAPDIIKILDQ